MLKSPLALATRCYNNLFATFRLRNYFTLDQESQVQEEYVSFIDELRLKFAAFDQPTLLVPDTIDFLMEQTTLATRPLLLQSFKLACVCLDGPFRPLPPVKFSSFNTEDPTSKLVDVILPVQSFFKHVVNSIESATSDVSISEFLELESTFGRSAFSDTYSPWTGLDSFGKTTILSKLDPDSKFRSAAGGKGSLVLSPSSSPPVL